MIQLTTRQKEILIEIGNTLIPSLEKVGEASAYWERKASDMPLVEQIVEIISSLPLEEQKEFKSLLNLMDSRALGLTWMGPLKSFSNLSTEQRGRLMVKWATSPISDIRKGFNSLKKLIGIVFYGYSDTNGNPNWKDIGYPGLMIGNDIRESDDSRLDMYQIQSNEMISCDIVVIGSGAGGGVVAAELVKKGYDVIVLEKGSYISENEMSGRELEMLGKTYDRKGAFSSNDGAITILAGSCVGGGTTVNWSASFRTPDYILEEWAKEHGNPHFISSDYQKYFDMIEQRTNINTELSIHNPQNSKLFEGAEKLGYQAGIIPRNVAPPKTGTDIRQYWKSQGYGGLGDAWGYKQGTMKTFLKDAVEGGARIFADTRVEKINHAGGKVTGVLAVQKDKNGHANNLTITCKKVVLSAGALHTPVILRKSGLNHPQIGRNLYLHPVNAVSAEYDEPIEAWYGPMMTAVCDEFIRLDGNFGYKLETPPLHCGFMALSTPWVSGEQYKRDMMNIPNLGAFIVLTRDKYGGKVTVGKEGRPLVDYKLNAYDKRHLLHGLKEATKIHVAAGARKIRLLHNNIYECVIGKDNVDDFIQNIDRINWSKNRFMLYSAHQMGTCRMGGRDKDHPIKPTGETREIDNLFVADASAFPRCSGVNPMLSIQAMALYISEHI